MPNRGLPAAKQLFWTELNYNRANEPLSRRPWPERAQEVLAGDPVILAEHDDFHIIYAQLAEGQVGRSFPLSLTAERLAKAQPPLSLTSPTQLGHLTIPRTPQMTGGAGQISCYNQHALPAASIWPGTNDIVLAQRAQCRQALGFSPEGKSREARDSQ